MGISVIMGFSIPIFSGQLEKGEQTREKDRGGTRMEIIIPKENLIITPPSGTFVLE